MSTLVLFNKPYDVLCQFSPREGRATLSDYLPQRDVYPAGRLDADSEGLLILTADGALQHRIADPHHKLPKIYCAQVEGTIDPAALNRLRQGVEVGQYTTRPATVRVIAEPAWLWPRVPPIRTRRHIPTSWIEITLMEGKNRQVRRMTAAVGFPTLRLVRRAIGNWTVVGLEPGEWREARVAETAMPSRERSSRSSRRQRSTARRAPR